MTSHLYAYAKAYFAAISAGILYLATVIGPDITFSDFGHISLLHWIGFVGSILGVGAGTAAITNGPPQAKQNADGSHVITSLPDAAPAKSFAPTQAKLDALAAPLPEQEYVPLDKPTIEPASAPPVFTAP